MLSGLIAWTCFAIATWHGEGRRYWLAPLAISLNALFRRAATLRRERALSVS